MAVAAVGHGIAPRRTRRSALRRDARAAAARLPALPGQRLRPVLVVHLRVSVPAQQRPGLAAAGHSATRRRVRRAGTRSALRIGRDDALRARELEARQLHEVHVDPDLRRSFWALGFLGGQGYEYTHLILGDHVSWGGSGIFGASFFTLTGMHGFHVFVGVCYLTVLLLQSAAGIYTGKSTSALRPARCIGTSSTSSGSYCSRSSIDLRNRRCIWISQPSKEPAPSSAESSWASSRSTRCIKTGTRPGSRTTFQTHAAPAGRRRDSGDSRRRQRAGQLSKGGLTMIVTRRRVSRLQPSSAEPRSPEPDRVRRTDRAGHDFHHRRRDVPVLRLRPPLAGGHHDAGRSRHAA